METGTVTVKQFGDIHEEWAAEQRNAKMFLNEIATHLENIKSCVHYYDEHGTLIIPLLSFEVNPSGVGICDTMRLIKNYTGITPKYNNFSLFWKYVTTFDRVIGDGDSYYNNSRVTGLPQMTKVYVGTFITSTAMHFTCTIKPLHP